MYYYDVQLYMRRRFAGISLSEACPIVARVAKSFYKEAA